MVTKVVMPRLSLTMKEGTVIQWFKKEGETVQKGEPVVEILSEKVTYDVEAPQSGVLRKVLAAEGENVPIDQAIGVIAAPDEAISEAEMGMLAPQSKVQEAAVAKLGTPAETGRVLASPAAKRLAKELGIDLTQIVGAGPEGRVVEEDVRRFAQKLAGKPKVREVIPLVGIRKTTAERVSLSARTAPHSTITMEVDMANAESLRRQTNISFTDVLVKAVAQALKEHMYINSTLENDQIKVYEDINIGVAVATEKGLVVPVIHKADKKALSEVVATLKELIAKAREDRLTKDDLTGGTFTITNLGMYGVEMFIPIINPPEAAILGVGETTQRPAVENGEIKIKPIVRLSLSYDHRIVDGAPAAQFLQKIRRILESGLNQIL